MNATVYERLKQAARDRQLVTYSDLGAAISLKLTDAAGVNHLGVILEEIAEHELANGRPILVALVIRGDTGMPGGGLFKYAKRKGFMKGKSDLEFWAEEVKKAYAAWKVS